MTILVTAFDAFGGDALNASAAALELLPDTVGDTRLAKLILPTSFSRAWLVLERALKELAPKIVLLMGQAGGRHGVSLERQAVNMQDARIPDNDGAMPRNLVIVPGAPQRYETALPLDNALMALRQSHIPAEISRDAGQFVCNATLFHLLHHKATTRQTDLRAGFVHLPWLPAQAARYNEAPRYEAQEANTQDAGTQDAGTQDAGTQCLDATTAAKAVLMILNLALQDEAPPSSRLYQATR